MSIIYTVIANRTNVLAEYSPDSYAGNFIGITQRLLQKTPTQDAKQSYTYDGGKDQQGCFLFHFMVSDKITYLCMTSEGYTRMLSFKYLDEIKKSFISTYGERAKSLHAYSANADFKHKLQTLMDLYNSHEQNKIGKVTAQVAEVKDIMQENIEKVIEREELIVSLVGKSEALSTSSGIFQRNSKKLKRALWWKNVKLMMLIGFIIILVVYIVLATACGGFDLRKCT